MDHIDSMLKGNPDDIVLGEISTNRCHAFADLIRFVCLQMTSTTATKTSHICTADLLTMSIHTVFVGVNRDCMHREFMSGAEDTDRDFLK